MNIKRAKELIIDSIKAYLLKNSRGEYVIPVVHQRPIFLLGAPGIGKTQIMEQIAAQCGIGLVSYTITHHTRQSAIGLPFLSKEDFGGRNYTVTEYTMSEIVASIYYKMKQTGLSEGILFIDEINCVSETLAPAMLQFLQYKSFGSHQIPEGWIIIAAGNPPEYNRSVRDFDVVTLDRVKKIEVEPDFPVWREYAWEAGVHPSILAYLELRPAHFYKMETTVDGRFFATPRGWEDLSRIMQVYEKLGIETDRDVVGQYIQHPDIAKDFANYLELYYKYQEGYQIEQIFQGNIPDVLLKKAAHAPFDERMSLIGLLIARCDGGFKAFARAQSYLSELHTALVSLKGGLEGLDPAAAMPCLAAFLAEYDAETGHRKEAGLLTVPQRTARLEASDFLSRLITSCKTASDRPDGKAVFALARRAFEKEKEKYEQAYEDAGQTLEYAFDFLESAFGNGQEIVMFLTQLNANRMCLSFLDQYDCPRYYQYSQDLLFEDRARNILHKIEQLK